jgi:hypothetical protein
MSEAALLPVLAVPERSRFVELEQVIEQGLQTFVDVGRALMEIRDSRFYRETFDSFEEYTQNRWGISRQRAHQLVDAAAVSTVVDVANERQARELAPVLRDEGEEAVLAVVQELKERWGDKLTADKIRQGVSERLSFEQKIGSLKSSKSVEWYTPAKYLGAVREVLGDIDLDPASSTEANRTVAARAFYDLEVDGLSQEWTGRVFMNPPYGNQCAGFIAKLLDEYKAGRVEAAILLLNAYSTDTKWFQPLWDYRLCFTDHRIDFYSPVYENGSNTITGSVFVYVGYDEDRFVRVFSQYGAVVERSKAA